jgi:hypothetical protein
MTSSISSDPTLINSQIEKTYWGNVDGKIIWLYKLSISNGLQMTVTNYGGIVQSLLVATAEEVKGEFQGLKLPKEVIDKIFQYNAVRWFKIDA